VARPVRWDLIADPTRYVRGFDVAERRGRQFQQHQRQLTKSNTRFSASLGSLGPVAVRAVGGATVALGGLAAAGAILGLKTAANLETAEVAFTRLLGSGKRARSFLGDLKSFAAKTPFELPGLVDASRALIGAGTAAKDVIPVLTSLGDASGALGLDQERFGRVMLAVTQIMNRGKIQAEELNQITEAGIPVWQLLAKATGKPVPELQKLMQSGDLLAKNTLPLLFEQMRKDYGGGMIAQSKTLAGVWSTVKDTIALTLSEALQPLLPFLKDALPQAADAFRGSVQKIVSFFRDDLAPELGRVKKAWDDNKASFEALALSLGGGSEKMKTSKERAQDLAGTLEQLIQFAGSLARGLKQVEGQLNALARAAEGAGAFIHRTFWRPMAIGLGTLVRSWIAGFHTMVRVAATAAEAMRLPWAKSIRRAEQDIAGFRSTFNAQMNALQDERVNLGVKGVFQPPAGMSMRDIVFRARGGPISGPGSSTSDSIPAMLSRGEHVWSAREVQGAGGHAAVEGMRRQARGFAAGGRVEFDQNLPSARAMAGASAGMIARITDLIQRNVQAFAKLAGNPTILAFIRSVDRLPYIWGAAGPHGYDCSGLVSAVYGLHTRRGGGHGQRYFTTATIGTHIPGLRSGLGGMLNIGVTPGRGHMAGSYMGMGFEAESTATGIKIGGAASPPSSFARHFHMARGGAVDWRLFDLLTRSGADIGGDAGRLRINGKVLDSGGWLMPGTTLATNRTGRPERVLPPGQPQTVVNVTVNVSGVVGTSPRQVADQLVPEIRRGLNEYARRTGQKSLLR
jgi:tape measure domain-containing protein